MSIESPNPSFDLEANLRAAFGRACQAQNIAVITQGRREILALPRDFVLQNIERIAADALPLEDEWEFRRLLEFTTTSIESCCGGLLRPAFRVATQRSRKQPKISERDGDVMLDREVMMPEKSAGP